MEKSNYKEVRKDFYFYQRNKMASSTILSKIAKQQQQKQKVIRLLPFLKEKIEENLIEKYTGKQFKNIKQFKKEIEKELKGSHLKIIYKKGELEENVGVYQFCCEECINLEIWITFAKKGTYIIISDLL